MYKYKTERFIFKNQMVDYIADYYSYLGEALTDMEYDELVSIYVTVPELGQEKNKAGEFKDFIIYRYANGSWEVKRRA